MGLHQPDLQPRWITSGSCCTCSCSPQYSSVSCETSSPSPRPWSTKCPNRFVPCPRFRTSRTFLTAIKRPPQHHRRWRPTGKPMHECQLLLLFCIISPQWSDHCLSSSKKRPSLQSKHLGLSSFTRYSLDTPSRSSAQHIHFNRVKSDDFFYWLLVPLVLSMPVDIYSIAIHIHIFHH